MRSVLGTIVAALLLLIAYTVGGEFTYYYMAKNVERAYLLGCGLGRAKQYNFTVPLPPQDVVFCHTAASYFNGTLNPSSGNGSK
jgi:hypothetical protein